MKRGKTGQIKFSISEEMLAEVERSAKIYGHSVSAEIRARIAAFKEDHRLVEITRFVPRSELGKTS